MPKTVIANRQSDNSANRSDHAASMQANTCQAITVCEPAQGGFACPLASKGRFALIRMLILHQRKPSSPLISQTSNPPIRLCTRPPQDIARP